MSLTRSQTPKTAARRLSTQQSIKLMMLINDKMSTIVGILTLYNICEFEINKSIFFFLYLRNKETQQTLRDIVSIQYDASF